MKFYQIFAFTMIMLINVAFSQEQPQSLPDVVSEEEAEFSETGMYDDEETTIPFFTGTTEPFGRVLIAATSPTLVSVVEDEGTEESTESVKPVVFALYENYPNPFNPSTVIRYQLPVTSLVTLKVYNALGQEVVTLIEELQEAGFHSVDFDATNLGSGIYVYRLQAGTFADQKKMILVK
ncbi:MAG: T9SS type A sorting domain-containing protein [Ignavibacteriae bacterium]|nr:T9SS type A sorting domain-containing protein [Ignavibacteriota bacterium]